LRRVGVAFSGEHGRDALLQLASAGGGIIQKRDAAACHHVDKSGSDHLIAQGDDLSGRAALQIADGSDSAAADSEIGAVPGIARSVDNTAALQNQVEVLAMKQSCKAKDQLEEAHGSKVPFRSDIEMVSDGVGHDQVNEKADDSMSHAQDVKIAELQID